MNSEALAKGIQKQLGADAPDTHADRPPPRVPDYQLVARIGRGSYGEVWLAQAVTGGWHAVKIVWRGSFSSERPYEREFNGIVRFEPISRSHHGVVNVLHVGHDDTAGCFYYVMELADAAESLETRGPKTGSEGRNPDSADPHDGNGAFNPRVPATNSWSPTSYTPRTLASDLKERGRMPVIEAVTLGVQLADALGHLHRHKLVHRDVKPSNVIFVGGLPKLADIGLVAGMDEARSFVGTEGFIPPEGPGSASADIFSLGRLMYEAATGKDRCQFPMLPPDLDRWSRLEREAMLELNEVLARACSVDPRARHANAAELAGDLNLILAGRSVRHAYGLESRMRRAGRVAMASALGVLMATCVVWFQREQQRSSESRALREAELRRRAESAEQESRQQLHTALLEQARATVLSGELGQRVRALDATRRAAAISNSAALRGAALSALALPDLRFEREWSIPPGTTLAELDPIFEWIALGNGKGPVEIRSLSDRHLRTVLPAQADGRAYVSSWSPDGRRLAIKRDDPRTGGKLPVVEVWDVAAARCVLLVTNVARSAFSFHPRLPRLIVGTPGSTAVTWDLESGTQIRQYPLKGEPEFLRYSPDGEHVAALHVSGKGWWVSVHRTTDGVPQANQPATEVASAFRWHPVAPWIAVGDRGGGVHLMNAHTGETRLLGKHKSLVAVTVFSPGGDYLFTGGWDRELICWDVKTGLRAFTITLSSYLIQFRADGRQCAILDLEAPRLELRTFDRPDLYREVGGNLGGGRNHAVFSPDSRWLAACGDERMVVWDLASEGPGAVVNEPQLRRVSFAPQGELFASRIGAGFRWCLAPGSQSNSPPRLDPLVLPGAASLVSLSLASNAVALTSDHGSRLIRYEQFDNPPGDWKPSVDGLNGTSSDGRWLGMFRSYSPQLHIHRLPDLEHVVTLTNEAPISMFEFSPPGDEVAVASRRGVEFWSTRTWERTRRLTDFTAILYSPDARTFWLAKEYHSAGLYDAGSAELILPLPPGNLPLAVSADGRLLATGVNATRVQVWDLVEARRQLRALGLDWGQTP